MSGLPAYLQTPITEFLREKFSSTAEIKSFSSMAGGCINQCGKLLTSVGPFFLKWNEARKFPATLAAEAKGLQLLRDPNVIHVPEVLRVDEVGDHQFMLM